MLHQSEEVVRAQVEERRSQLLAEAQANRLARRLRPPTPTALQRLLAAMKG